MAKFKYRARTAGGDLQVGVIDAETRSEATNILLSHNLYVLLLDEVRKKEWYDKFVDYFLRVKTKDLMIFTRQFATLLSAKIPLDDAVRTLVRQTENETLRETVRNIAADIETGLSLSQSLEKYGEVFSTFYVNMVRSAEVTGRVDEAMGFLADYIEKQAELISKVRNALIYPAVMVSLFIVVGGIMVVIVFPQIGPVFEEAGVELPIVTRILIGGGEFLAQWWWIVLTLLVFSVFAAINYLRTEEGKALRDEILFKTPVASSLLKSMYVARFADSLSVLIKGGIPVAQAVEITGHTIGSPTYSEILHDASNDLRRGESLSHSLYKHTSMFPPLVTQMIAVGENTGRIDELLGKVSEFYSREVEGLVGGLVELIQPILMVVIGVMIGGLFASILIPIYNLAQSF